MSFNLIIDWSQPLSITIILSLVEMNKSSSLSLLLDFLDLLSPGSSCQVLNIAVLRLRLLEYLSSEGERLLESRPLREDLSLSI